MDKFAALYARSSKDRADVSVDSQIRELGARAKHDGYLVVATYHDKALSGKDDDRPGFQEMIRVARSKDREWSRLYVFDTARFSRSVFDAAVYERELANLSVEIVYLQIPDGADQATRELITQVFRGINRWHSVKSKTDAVRGMKENVRRGFRAGGSAPYGYRLAPQDTGAVRDGRPVTKSKLTVDPQTAPIVGEYFTRRSKGEGRKAIAADFNRRGVPSPRRSRWSPTTLRAFEDNIDTYRGTTVWGRSGARHSSGYTGARWCPEKEWTVMPNTHEAIISADTADLVLAQRSKRRKIASRPSDYLLTGTLFCGCCGAGYVGAKGYYQCSGRGRFGKGHCSNGQVSQQAVEAAIQRVIRDEIIRPEFADEYLAAARRALRTTANQATDLERLRVRHRKVEQAITRWIQSFETENGALATAAQRIRELEAEKQSLAEKIEEIEKASRVIPLDGGVSTEFLRELLGRFDEVMGLGDIHDRRALLSHVVNRIELGERHGRSRARSLVVQATLATDE